MNRIIAGIILLALVGVAAGLTHINPPFVPGHGEPVSCDAGGGYQGVYYVTMATTVEIDLPHHNLAPLFCSFLVVSNHSSTLTIFGATTLQVGHLNLFAVAAGGRIEFSCPGEDRPFFISDNSSPDGMGFYIQSYGCSTVNVSLFLPPMFRDLTKLGMTFEATVFSPSKPCINGATAIIHVNESTPTPFALGSISLSNVDPFYIQPLTENSCYDNEYPPYASNWNCAWRLIPEPGVRLKVGIESYIEMRPSDSLMITDVGAGVSTELNRPTTDGSGAYPAFVSQGGELLVTFRTGPAPNYRAQGFELQIHPITTAPPVFCGGTVSTTAIGSGHVLSNIVGATDKSDLIDSMYFPGTVCKWIITTQGTGQQIRVRDLAVFTEMDVDYLYLYDGLSLNDESLIAKLSGQPYLGNQTYTTGGDTLVIVFNVSAGSRANVVAGTVQYGFLLTYDVVAAAEPTLPYTDLAGGSCAPLTRIKALEGVFSVGDLTTYQSPGYMPNLDCGWIIEVPESFVVTLRYSSISLYDNGNINPPLYTTPGDSLVYYRGDAPIDDNYIDHVPPVFVNCVPARGLGGPVVYVRFRTDGARSLDGWGFQLSFIAEPLQTVCYPWGVPVERPANYFESQVRGMGVPSSDPNIEAVGPYLSNANCSYAINMDGLVRIRFNMLDVKFGDSLRVYSGIGPDRVLVFDQQKYCDPLTLIPTTMQQGPRVFCAAVDVTTSGPIVVEFLSDDSSMLWNGDGFSFHWYVVTPPEPCGGLVDYPMVSGGSLTFPSNLAYREFEAYLFDQPLDCVWTVSVPPGHLAGDYIFPVLNLLPGDEIHLYNGNSTDIANQLAVLVGSFDGMGLEFSWLPTVETMTVRFLGVPRRSYSIDTVDDCDPFYGFELALQGILFPPNGTSSHPYVDENLCEVYVASETFDDPAQLEFIASCTTIIGNLVFESGGIVSLPNLRRVDGDIVVVGCYEESPTSPSFLDVPNLESARRLTFQSGTFASGLMNAPKLFHLECLFINAPVVVNGSVFLLPSLTTVSSVMISVVPDRFIVSLPILATALSFEFACFENENPADVVLPALQRIITSPTTGGASICVDEGATFRSLSFPNLVYAGGPASLKGSKLDAFLAPKLLALLDLLRGYESVPISIINHLDLSSVRYFCGRGGSCIYQSGCEGQHCVLNVRNLTLPSVTHMTFPFAVMEPQGVLQALSLPLLKFSPAFSLCQLTALQFIDAPQILATAFAMSGASGIKTISMPRIRYAIVAVAYGNIALRLIDMHDVQTLELQVTSGNNKLRVFDLPYLTYSPLLGLQSLDITAFSAPQLTVIGDMVITQSRLTNLSFPLLVSAQHFCLTQSIAFTSLFTPQLRTLGVKFVVKDTGLSSLQLPALQTIGDTLDIESNYNLYDLHFCQLTSIHTVTVVASPLLSCAETRTMFAAADTLVMGSTDCAEDLVGTFGCRANFTRAVNISECGYTVACIQEALMASYTDSNIVIFAPAGTYRNCSSPLSFLGRSLVLRGAGMGATIIDCEGVGIAFVANQGEEADTILSDITFSRGYSAVNGGMFRMSGGSPTLLRVSFERNRADSLGGAGTISSAHPRFIGCTFVDNSAGVGGGAVAVTENASPFFSNCTFSSNTAGDYGGALAYVSASPSNAIADVIIADNSASRGGGVFADGPLLMTGTRLTRNVGSKYGGGLAAVPVQAIGVVYQLENCDLSENTGNQGAGIFSYSGTLSLVNTRLTGNAADDSGGGVYAACSVTYRTLAGLTSPCAVFINVTSGTISSNEAHCGNGGGISAQNVQVMINGATLQDNTALHNGGGVYVSGTHLSVTGAPSSTFSANQAGAAGGGVYCAGDGACRLSGATITNNRAVNAGGGVYWCRSGCTRVDGTVDVFVVSGATITGNDVGIAGYGPQEATDPVVLSWTAPPNDQVVSGFALASAADHSLEVLVQDSYGQTVSASIDVLQLSISDGSGVSLLGSTTVLATEGNAIFGETRAVALDAASTGQLYALLCKHTSLAHVNVTWTFTLLPCQPGMGIAPDGSEAREGAPARALVCEVCAAGQFTGSDGICVPCAVGSFAAQAGATACTPCAEDTYQPAPGAISCTKCADGSHAPPGSPECTQDGALSVAAIAGAVSGVLFVLLIAALIVAWCVYRYSKKKTMARYYLEEDATIRRGVKDSSLALAIRKFITASTTTRIGGGEFTDVYKGRHEGQWIALKVVKGDAVGQSLALTEFRREVVALTILNEFKHPAIVELKFYLERSPVCIGLSFYANGSLKRCLGSLHLTVGQKVTMAAQVASALTTLHAADIAHCDLKTDNILLSDDNMVKLADFGICHVLGETRLRLETGVSAKASAAKTAGDDAAAGAAAAKGASLAALSVETVVDTEGCTTTRSVFDQRDSSAFTPQYVDPCLLRLDADMSDETLRRADIFSFGMVMWAIYKQEEPFAGVDPIVLAEQRRDRPDMRPGAVADCHPCYERVMLQATTTEPLARPSANECLAQLRQCLKEHFDADLPESYLPSHLSALDDSHANSAKQDSPMSGPPRPVSSASESAPAFDSQLATQFGVGSQAAVQVNRAYDTNAVQTMNGVAFPTVRE